MFDTRVGIGFADGFSLIRRLGKLLLNNGFTTTTTETGSDSDLPSAIGVITSLSTVSVGNTVASRMRVDFGVAGFLLGEVLGLPITIGSSTVLLMLVLGKMAVGCDLFTVVVPGLSTIRSVPS